MNRPDSPSPSRRSALTAAWQLALASLSQPAWVRAAEAPAALPEATPPAEAGLLQLAVDATDLNHRVLQVQMTVPVARPGERLTLHYPRWLPGTHGPFGQVHRLAGLMVWGAGQRLAWQRDPVDLHAFHLDVPAGVQRLQLAFQYLSPLKSGADRVSIGRALLGVQWDTVLLYPAQPATAADPALPAASPVRVQARLKLPAGWQAASALRAANGQATQADADGWVVYAPTSLETLVDSPVVAGLHHRRIELDPPGTPQPVTLQLFADEAKWLQTSPEQLEAHRALVQQADRLFGQRPFRHYDFLLSLSAQVDGIGLEHHESSENGVGPGYFQDWSQAIRERELLPHEYTHSWNGKYRRPADLWTPHYQQPMRNSLLWVYEGLTEYWGHVLAARAGLSTPEQARTGPRPPGPHPGRCPGPQRPAVAQPARHHHHRQPGPRPRPQLARLATRPRLLPRRRAAVAGRGHPDPPAQRWPALARRLGPPLLRHALAAPA